MATVTERLASWTAVSGQTRAMRSGLGTTSPPASTRACRRASAFGVRDTTSPSRHSTCLSASSRKGPNSKTCALTRNSSVPRRKGGSFGVLLESIWPDPADRPPPGTDLVTKRGGSMTPTEVKTVYVVEDDPGRARTARAGAGHLLRAAHVRDGARGAQRPAGPASRRAPHRPPDRRLRRRGPGVGREKPGHAAAGGGDVRGPAPSAPGRPVGPGHGAQAVRDSRRSSAPSRASVPAAAAEDAPHPARTPGGRGSVERAHPDVLELDQQLVVSCGAGGRSGPSAPRRACGGPRRPGCPPRRSR